jgi:hypothetical protein
MAMCAIRTSVVDRELRSRHVDLSGDCPNPPPIS